MYVRFKSPKCLLSHEYRCLGSANSNCMWILWICEHRLNRSQRERFTPETAGMAYSNALSRLYCLHFYHPISYISLIFHLCVCVSFTLSLLFAVAVHFLHLSTGALSLSGLCVYVCNARFCIREKILCNGCKFDVQCTSTCLLLIQSRLDANSHVN